MITLKYFFIVLLIHSGLFNIKIVAGKRQKRALIFPAPKSKVQFIYGIGLPVALEDISIVRGYVVKANYPLPYDAWNITHPETIITRRKRDSQVRWSLYNVFSSLLERYGGKSCILKTICEFSEAQIDRTGLYEQIFHVLFRPSSTQDKILNIMDKEFLSAEKFGRSNRDICGIIYLDCTISLLKYFLI